MQLAELGKSVNQDGVRRDGIQVLTFPDGTFDDLVKLYPDLADVPADIQMQIGREALYVNYLERQERDAEAVRKDEEMQIPQSFRYDGIQGLSNELKTKLNVVRPTTLGQAGRIDGMTPAALTLLLAKLRQAKRAKASCCPSSFVKASVFHVKQTKLCINSRKIYSSGHAA